ncbi:unnamed protein product [Danaus chrysippus]|uniref:(African queen) hypothetical protein n=1 Tax=Danaus chrysippus TaxID=151541 RepID=A0A8J2WDD1_9NEOP|nr:unnamed protein product [Danaus chrysippus]
MYILKRGRRFESYRDIRYAEPPVGELRFQPPVAITQYGPACPHRTRAGSYVSEACLRINVYTPLREDRSGPLAVVVYIHAGGLYSMTSRVVGQRPAARTVVESQERIRELIHVEPVITLSLPPGLIFLNIGTESEQARV